MAQTKLTNSQVRIAPPIPQLSEDVAQDLSPGGIIDYADDRNIIRRVTVIGPSGLPSVFGVNVKNQRVNITEYWEFQLLPGIYTPSSLALDIGASGLLLATTPRTATTLTVPAGQVMALRTYTKNLLSNAAISDTYVHTAGTVLSPVTPVDSVDGVYHVTTATWPYGLVAQHPYLKIALLDVTDQITVLQPGVDLVAGNDIVANASVSVVILRRSNIFTGVAFPLGNFNPGDVTVNVPSSWEFNIRGTTTSTTLEVRAPTDMTITFNQPITFQDAHRIFADPMNITQAELDDCMVFVDFPFRQFKILGVS